MEREDESGGKLGDLDLYEIEGAETKGEVLQNLAEFQFSCVCTWPFWCIMSSVQMYHEKTVHLCLLCSENMGVCHLWYLENHKGLIVFIL